MSYNVYRSLPVDRLIERVRPTMLHQRVQHDAGLEDAWAEMNRRDFSQLATNRRPPGPDNHLMKKAGEEAMESYDHRHVVHVSGLDRGYRR